PYENTIRPLGQITPLTPPNKLMLSIQKDKKYIAPGFIPQLNGDKLHVLCYRSGSIHSHFHPLYF
ncbi:MAG: hypothetical protein AAF206_18220, partial [Bacteroidota bacterium]